MLGDIPQSVIIDAVRVPSKGNSFLATHYKVIWGTKYGSSMALLVKTLFWMFLDGLMINIINDETSIAKVSLMKNLQVWNVTTNMNVPPKVTTVEKL